MFQIYGFSTEKLGFFGPVDMINSFLFRQIYEVVLDKLL